MEYLGFWLLALCILLFVVVAFRKRAKASGKAPSGSRNTDIDSNER